MCVYMQHMYIHTCSALMFHTKKTSIGVEIQWGGNPWEGNLWKSNGVEIPWGGNPWGGNPKGWKSHGEEIPWGGNPGGGKSQGNPGKFKGSLKDGEEIPRKSVGVDIPWAGNPMGGEIN